MPERRIATVLMLDVVGSTHIAAELGDTRFRELSSRFDRIVRAALKRFAGREEDHAGDGFFATFAQPDRAIRAAASIAEEVRTLGIEVRCGVHTGQTESLGGKTQGIAVVIGARVMSLAGPGEILATSTTKELVEGSRFGFEDLSAHELKGVPGTWRVFAVTELDGEERGGPLPAVEAAERRTSIHPSAGTPERRPFILIAGAVAVTAVVVIAVVAARDDPARPPVNRAIEPPAHAVVEVDPARASPLIGSIRIPTEQHGAVPLPTSAHPIVVGEGGVWTVRWRSLFHVDPSRSEVRERITIEGGIPFSINLAVGLDKVWVASDSGLREVNPATGEQRRVIPLASEGTNLGATDVTVGGGFVWLGVGDGQLIRLDPRTGRQTVRTGLDPIDTISFGAGSVWTLDAVGGTLLAYDPETIRPRAPVTVSGDDVIVGESSVWVLSRGVGALASIDLATNEPERQVQVGPSPIGLTSGGGAIWVGDEDGVIRRVDEATGLVTEISVGGEIRGLAYDEESGTLWVDLV